MSDSLHEYRLSGAAGGSPFIVPLVGILSSLVMSVAYAYVTVYSPIGGYISILFVLGYGFAVGVLTAMAARLSKCRNPKLAAALGFLVSLFALYSAWVLFVFVVLRRSGLQMGWAFLPDMFISPGATWGFIKALNAEGWFSIAGGTPTGIILWIFWAIEAIIIVLMVTIITHAAIDEEVFCENCRKWTETDPPLRLALPDDEDVIPRLIAGDVGALHELSAADLGEYPHLVAEVKHCEQCNQTATYQLKFVDMEADKDEEPKETSKNLTKTLVLTEEAYNGLQKLAQASPYRRATRAGTG